MLRSLLKFIPFFQMKEKICLFTKNIFYKQTDFSLFYFFTLSLYHFYFIYGSYFWCLDERKMDNNIFSFIWKKGINFNKDLSNNVYALVMSMCHKDCRKINIRKQIMLTHAQHLKLMKATLLVFVLAIHLNGVMIKLIVCRSCHFQHTQFLFSLKKISLTAFLNLCVWLH